VSIPNFPRGKKMGTFADFKKKVEKDIIQEIADVSGDDPQKITRKTLLKDLNWSSYKEDCFEEEQSLWFFVYEILECCAGLFFQDPLTLWEIVPEYGLDICDDEAIKRVVRIGDVAALIDYVAEFAYNKYQEHGISTDWVS
jgi:hypothetical protein